MDHMDISDIWQNISDVVLTGRETALVDLKCSFYDFKNPEKKGDFIKDMSSLANSLGHGDAKGYIVIGVKDETMCQNRVNQEDFLTNINVPDLDKLELQSNEIIEKYLDPRLTIECVHLQPSVTMLYADIITYCVSVQSGISETDQRPYVVN
jgi:hypothetical protein